MVGLSCRAEHGRASPPERLVGLEGIGLRLSKVVLSRSTQLDPFTGNRGRP